MSQPADELAVASEAATTPGGTAAAVLALEGDLDLASAEAFERAVEDTGDVPVVIDLSGVRFIDSSGIHGVVRARLGREERGLAAALVVAEGEAVDRVLEMSGLRERLDPKPDRDAALAALDAGVPGNGGGR